MAPQYAIGPDYLGLPGNNERFFGFHIALFVLGAGTAIVAWQTIDRTGLEPRGLLDADRIGVACGEDTSRQYQPEQSTSAIICHHPRAEYPVARSAPPATCGQRPNDEGPCRRSR